MPSRHCPNRISNTATFLMSSHYLYHEWPGGPTITSSIAFLHSRTHTQLLFALFSFIFINQPNRIFMTKTIVLIHGNFVNNTSWSAWKPYYEKRGYTVYTPANPGH